MYCPQCGSQNPDNVTTCRACGIPLGNPYQSTMAGPGAAPPPPGERVPTHLVPAILTTLFCCMPFGIVAIVFAAQVGSKQDAGDYDGARRASQSARTWCWVAAGCGLVIIAIYAIGIVAVGVNGHR